MLHVYPITVDYGHNSKTDIEMAPPVSDYCRHMLMTGSNPFFVIKFLNFYISTISLFYFYKCQPGPLNLISRAISRTSIGYTNNNKGRINTQTATE